jgi:hypothetical protein
VHSQVLDVATNHIKFSLSKQLIVLHLGRHLVFPHSLHAVHNKHSSPYSESMFEHLHIIEIGSLFSLVFHLEQIWDLRDVLKWERKLSTFLGFFHEFEDVTTSLAKHYDIISLISWNR